MTSDLNLESGVKQDSVKEDKSRYNIDFYRETGKRYTKRLSYFNTIECHGSQNIDLIIDGPALIIPNHVGSFKDILALFDCFDKKGIQLFYGSRSDLLDKDETYLLVKKHLQKHLRLASHLIRNDLIRRFADYTSSSLPKLDPVPLDLTGGSNRKAMRIIEKYLADYNRKVVLFQFDEQKRKKKAYKHSIFYGAKIGAPVIAKWTYQDYGINVPAVPAGIYGSRGLIPLSHMITTLSRKPIRVNIGAPLYITSFLDQENPAEAMRQTLERKIWGLLRELIEK